MATFRDFAKENSDGWSLIAIESTIDAVAEVVRNADQVTEYEANVPVRVMANSKDEDGNYIVFTPSPQDRTCFAVSVLKSKWCIIFRTLYWCDNVDNDWVIKSAMLLSQSLGCETIASCGGGHGFSTCIYRVGKLESELPAYDHRVISKEFTSRKVRIPLCFIGGVPSSLYAQEDSAADIERADRIRCRIADQ